MSNQRLNVVVVSYNSEADLPKCISSVIKNCPSYIVPTVVVVDNNSADSSIEVANKAGAKVIASKTNAGFSRAVNVGLKAKAADYYLLLNPDAQVLPGCIEKLIAKVDSDDKIAAAGPHMQDSKGTNTSQGYYMKTPSFLSVLLFSTGLRKYFIQKPKVYCSIYQECNLSNDRQVEQIPGACLMMTAKVLSKVGKLDEDFAIWYEDVEWSYRARKLGFQLWYIDDAHAIHEGGVSFKKWNNINMDITFYVSMKTFFAKNKPIAGFFVKLAITAQRLALLLFKKDKNQKVFIRKFWTLKKGILPQK